MCAWIRTYTYSRSVHVHTTHQTGQPLHPLPAVAFAGRTCIIDQEMLCKTKKVRHKSLQHWKHILWKRRAALKTRRSDQLWASRGQGGVQSNHRAGKAECSLRIRPADWKKTDVWKVTILRLVQKPSEELLNLKKGHWSVSHSIHEAFPSPTS